MPYRNDSAVDDRVLALVNEIAELRVRSHELPYLDTKRQNLEHELAVLTNRNVPTTRVARMTARLRAITALQAVGVVVVLLVFASASFYVRKQIKDRPSPQKETYVACKFS